MCVHAQVEAGAYRRSIVPRVRALVAPTDYGWYRFLQARPELREVNFWRPSQKAVKAIAPGELFFFKLKAPYNAIAGFGIFTRAAVLPVWEAWDVFGPANGTADMAELIQRLAKLSNAQTASVDVDTWISCLAINEPVFFPPDEWVEPPADWHPQIVSAKTYDLTSGEGKRLYERCLERAQSLSNDESASDLEERYGPARLVKPRLGQATFRIAVLDAYGKRCAVTGERSLPVIEASHIRPYAAGGEHTVNNGLPLRRDVHRLFDLGFVSVRPDYRFVVSPALRDEYSNGRAYYQLDGREIHEPLRPSDRPDPEVLEWHYEEVFRR